MPQTGKKIINLYDIHPSETFLEGLKTEHYNSKEHAQNELPFKLLKTALIRGPDWTGRGKSSSPGINFLSYLLSVQ